MVTIVAATNRTGSYTLKLSEYYQKKLKEHGVDADILTLTDLPANILHTDLYGNRSKEFQPIQDLVTATEKFLFVVPEYNGSFPGVLKLFVDACKFPESFFGKKAALLGLSSGKYGNVRGIEHFTGICHYINLHVMPLRLHIPQINLEFNENGDLFKEDTVKFTDQQISRFVEF
ncbi:NADPH-dependent FMN reductase [Pedobacter sp. HMF7647]|uniref:NADPH-dependent FMN reductase n=1 Tax=Hufsiella arboris TaxID=2695275 RepID=A0A7K1Y843_9SPHI|nr:NAD(P)H-dependent oxidoreductase [Hufsiella arboris]MXV50764.1 NADPH-dependent FMN reductase [Hufsiella arboris]